MWFVVVALGLRRTHSPQIVRGLNLAEPNVRGDERKRSRDMDINTQSDWIRILLHLDRYQV